MLDETMKTILIDESKAVYEVVAKVCEHIGLSNPEEYSFQAEASVVFLTKEEAARIKKKQSNDKPEEGIRFIQLMESNLIYISFEMVESGQDFARAGSRRHRYCRPEEEGTSN